MTENELNMLAEKIHELMSVERKSFFVDPEQHYQDHQSLHEMVLEWKAIKGMFWKAFIGAAILGAIILSGMGSIIKIFKG